MYNVVLWHCAEDVITIKNFKEWNEVLNYVRVPPMEEAMKWYLVGIYPKESKLKQIMEDYEKVKEYYEQIIKPLIECGEYESYCEWIDKIFRRAYEARQADVQNNLSI